MKDWIQATDILIPAWVADGQSEFQSRKYTDESQRMEFVLMAAAKNFELTGSAPLAAAVFMDDGALVSLGVDAIGIGGHEMTNALILASNLLGSEKLRQSSNWDLYSLAPPCTICFGNIYSERPRQFVCAVHHHDLLAALKLPNTPMPEPSWQKSLEARGIKINAAIAREQGNKVLLNTHIKQT